MKRSFRILAVAMVLLAGCKPDPKDLLDRATQAEKQALQVADTLRQREQLPSVFQPAIEDYARIVEDYPGTEFAEQALFKLAMIYNNNTRDFARAIDAFQRYAQTYPDGQKCAISMFFVGYIYNNGLGNIDSARAAYERFLTKFPDHEMAPSAQFELNTLGKSPEELLPTETRKTTKDIAAG